ncbi:MAG: DsbE family thiol:disulfide interchange protein [gamma proteobacterium symbiont of Bathyaustriella thionipta]|nr:DsbE family thiol:disulfide interchange protein [gamma proteobacterium symbiont of Bathyaustriella thionipta]
MNKAIIPLAGFIAMAALFYYVLGQMDKGEYNPRDVPTEFIGRQAPDFVLPDLFDAGKQVKSADMKGQLWLLNVWGTWCRECWREHEYLLQLVQSRGVRIIGINWRDEASAARNMLAQKGNPFYRVAFDPESEAIIEWGVYGAPETFLIDADGVIQAKYAGAMTESVWQEKFQPWFELHKEKL